MPTMDEYYPFMTGTGTAVDVPRWGNLERAKLTDGIVFEPEDGWATNLKVIPLTGVTLRCQPGQCSIRGHRGVVTSNKSITLADAHATQHRADLIVARLDLAVPHIEVVAKTGANHPTTPVLPTVTRAGDVWEIPLAAVAIAAAQTTITSGNISDERYVALTTHGAGGQLAYASNAALSQTLATIGDITGLSATFNTPGSRRIKTTVQLHVNGSTNGQPSYLRIRDGASATLTEGQVVTYDGNVPELVRLEYVETIAVGRHTRKASGYGALFESDTGNGLGVASILVEDLGPDRS